MNSTTFRVAWGFCAVIAGLLDAKSASAAPTFLVNPGVYTAIPSSTFNDPPLTFPVANLFDGINSTESVWAIQGFLGGNSQGRDEGWVSVTLDQSYHITDLLFAPRKPSGNTDGIDRADIWISNSPFGVNVTSNASTSAFLLTPAGMSPSISLGPFATSADAMYSLTAGGGLYGKYLLGRFVNITDHDNNRNLGVRTLEVGVVPEPGSMAIAAVGLVSLLIAGAYRRGRQSRPSLIGPV